MRRNRFAKRTQERTYESALAQRYDDVLRNSVNSMNAVMERSPSTSPTLDQYEPVPGEHISEEHRVYLNEPDQEFHSETMSELGSVNEIEPTDSGTSTSYFIKRLMWCFLSFILYGGVQPGRASIFLLFVIYKH